MAAVSAQRQLDGFIAKYSPEMQRQAKAAIRKMRARLPGAVEMVYDNYQWLVVGYGPNDRASEALFSLVFAPAHVSICFLRNARRLSDPAKLLRGEGSVVRNVRLVEGVDVDSPAVDALMREAEHLCGDPIPKTAQRVLIIKSVSEKQRPRRPAPPKARARSAARKK
ncbi:MAG: hypothetical protein QM773_03740 [Hyphomonadaceae bacterium]